MNSETFKKFVFFQVHNLPEAYQYMKRQYQADLLQQPEPYQHPTEVWQPKLRCYFLDHQNMQYLEYFVK